jgi:hypothetical protein
VILNEVSRITAIVGVVALVCASAVLPFTHLHSGIANGALVHTHASLHVTNHGASHGTTVTDDDHENSGSQQIGLLNPQAPSAPTQPALASSTYQVVLTTAVFAKRVTEIAPTHGPPILDGPSLRAPPA